MSDFLEKGFEKLSNEIREIKNIFYDDELSEKIKLKVNPYSSHIDLERIAYLQHIIKSLGGYYPIYVTEGFEISKGLRAFSLDVIIKLLRKITQDRSLRAIVGMCGEHYDWIKQSIFQTLRLIVSLSFDPFQPVSPKILINQITMTASFQKDAVYHTLFLNPKLDRGITKLTVKVEHIGGNFSFIGVAGLKTMALLRDNWIGGQHGGACYYSDPEFVCVYTKFHRTSFIDSSFKVEDGNILSAEVDARKKTIIFFHGDALLPFYVVNLPPETHFGYSGSRMGGVSIQFLSMRHLITSSIASKRFRATAVQWSG